MHKLPIYLTNNTYPPHLSCIVYDFRSHVFQPQTTDMFTKKIYLPHFSCIKYDSLNHTCRVRMKIIYVGNTKLF